MYLFVVALHVVLCVFLILIIILQPGKGGDIGAAFGGGSSGSSTVFGPRGPTGLLQRATTVVAVLFMCTSLTLALFSNQKMLSNANVEDEMRRIAEEDEKAKEAPIDEAAPTDVDVPTEAPADAPVEVVPEPDELSAGGAGAGASE